MNAGRIAAVLACLAVFTVIIFFTFRPSPNVQDISWMPQRWGLWLDEHEQFRHFVGMTIFTGMVLLLNFDSVFNRSRSRFVRKFRSSRHRTGRLGALLVLVYALELAQLGLPNRDFDWLDVVNGWAGVLAAWGFWYALKSRSRRQRSRANERRHEPINVSSVRFR